MKITITTPGDSSVGIQGECITIDWPGLEEVLADHEGREGMRRALAQTFGKWLAERATATFSDECPECGTVGRTLELTCPNAACPENVAWGQEPANA